MFAVAVVTAWIYPPAFVLYAAVIALMVRKVYVATEHSVFEGASHLLLIANTGLLFSIMMAAVVR